MIFKKNINYDRFKYFVRYIVPALIALVAGLGQVWGYDIDRVVQTMALTQVFLMTFVSMSKERYYKEEERLEREWQKQYQGGERHEQ